MQSFTSNYEYLSPEVIRCFHRAQIRLRATGAHTHTHTHTTVVCVCVKQRRHEAGQLQASAGKRSTDGANRDAPERRMAAGTERKEEIQNKPGRRSAFYSELKAVEH
ncbi:hypothetical protein ATANTOWER_016043 [Ataeniobius toweri]|uniref:Uncharacterized protein n=1 Tax=Ataeniobius toweri TaxID=208326 RepID=A0ABU7AYS6_9TELE|nr:hypothetical protein [Ataeniobius toweri]